MLSLSESVIFVSVIVGGHGGVAEILRASVVK